ncbi:unannotated protein [freshwater metagenome]|uniref:Unannotated protein n=1 Tax=freshwater metagenome TaxID=449393 RepID=A0A6J7VDY6_9ZZZZ
MTSSPLFTNDAELIVTTGPIDQVGCANASFTVTEPSSAAVLPLNGPPLAVRMSLDTSLAAPERSA